MDTAVIEYRKRRQMRLDARSEGEEARSTNQQNQRPVNHGNTKLPFGLCKKYGIAVEKGWTPRDAWSALADKGVTPNDEFSKRKGKSTFKALGYEYRNIHSVKKDDGQYSLYGDFDDVSPFSGRKESHTNSKYCDFICKDEMLSFLKDQGVTRFKDPDTGKTINPSEMDLPETVATVGHRRYKELTLGFRKDKTGHPYSGRGYAITGQDYTGKRTVLKVFKNPKEALEYAKKIGCPNEKLRRTKEYKDYMDKGIRGER